VLLSEPIYVDDYGMMPSLRQFDYLRKARGPIRERQARVVGYGLQGKNSRVCRQDWVRYAATSSVTGLEKSNVIGEQNSSSPIIPARRRPGGTCSGDSGGPAFFIDPATGDETNIVMAVNSYGIAPLCNGNDYQFRTDIEAAQDFVLPYLSWAHEAKRRNHIGSCVRHNTRILSETADCPFFTRRSVLFKSRWRACPPKGVRSGCSLQGIKPHFSQGFVSVSSHAGASSVKSVRLPPRSQI